MADVFVRAVLALPGNDAANSLGLMLPLRLHDLRIVVQNHAETIGASQVTTDNVELKNSRPRLLDPVLSRGIRRSRKSCDFWVQNSYEFRYPSIWTRVLQG